jgi:hypothetical protein
MKSPLVEYICSSVEGFRAADAGNYSELQVLKSAAGYYIGTLYTHPKGSEFEGLVEPGSRDSYDYYATEEEAQKALDENKFIQRDHP